jgi:hypothetical protein
MSGTNGITLKQICGAWLDEDNTYAAYMAEHAFVEGTLSDGDREFDVGYLLYAYRCDTIVVKLYDAPAVDPVAGGSGQGGIEHKSNNSPDPCSASDKEVEADINMSVKLCQDYPGLCAPPPHTVVIRSDDLTWKSNNKSFGPTARHSMWSRCSNCHIKTLGDQGKFIDAFLKLSTNIQAQLIS